MRKLLLIVLCFFLTNINSQVIKVNENHKIDFNNVPEKYKNATIYISEKKTAKLLALKSFKNGKRHGLFLSYWAQSLLVAHYSEANYKNGVLHGYYNSLDTKGFYKNGKKHGLWVFSNDLGDVKQITYRNGKKYGPCVLSDSFKEEKGFYKNGKHHKLWVSKEYDSDNFEKTNYKNGKRHGMSSIQLDGSYHKTEYKKGKKHGLQYSKEGSIVETFSYKKGIKHGKYHLTDGFMETTGWYTNGKKKGKWKNCERDNKNCKTQYYNNDILIEK